MRQFAQRLAQSLALVHVEVQRGARVCVVYREGGVELGVEIEAVRKGSHGRAVTRPLTRRAGTCPLPCCAMAAGLVCLQTWCGGVRGGRCSVGGEVPPGLCSVFVREHIL